MHIKETETVNMHTCHSRSFSEVSHISVSISNSSRSSRITFVNAKKHKATMISLNTALTGNKRH